MKISPECVPCLLNRLLYETNLVDPTKADEVIKEACVILAAELSPDVCSAELATHVHGKTYEILATDDPYKEVKVLAMEAAQKLEAKARARIDQSPSKLRAAVLCAIVGNVLDFGIEGSVGKPEEFVTKFDAIYNEGIGHDDIEKLKPYLNKGAKILLFTDNCGEIIFDKLLCEELKKFGVYIILVVKGVPILSDATMDEVKQIGMDEVVDKVITTGEYAVGLNINKIPPVLERYLHSVDLIISKGMANFEALSETDYRPILHILRTKCEPVAAGLGLAKGINAAKLIE